MVAATLDVFEDETLAHAQASINLPEVQEMLKRLAFFNLGVYMPHMHGEDGMFHAMPDGMVQVEKSLTVSFKTEEELPDLPSMVPVAWKWTGDGVKVGSVCWSMHNGC